MDASTQTIFNMVLGFGGFAGLFILKAIWDKLSALETTDKQLTEAINDMRVLVSGDYVKKVDINPMLQNIFDELKSINRELAHKAERKE